MAMARPLIRNPGVLAAIILLLVSPVNAPAGAQEGSVRAILFYSPTCPHCHEVMTRDLPPIVDKYGEQLRILAIDSSRPAGGQMYVAVARHFQIPQDQWSVPLLVVGDRVLAGSVEIPELLPGIIDRGLDQGGIDWPAIPAVLQVLEAEEIIDSADEVLRRAEERAASAAEGAGLEERVDLQAPIQEEADTTPPPAIEDADVVAPPGDTAEAPGTEEEMAARGAEIGVDTAQDEVPDVVPAADEREPAPVGGAREDAAGVEAGSLNAPVGASEVGTPVAAPDSAAGSKADLPDAIDPGPAGIVGTVQEAAEEIANMSMADRFALDRGGNTMAVIVLVWMLAVLALVLTAFLRTDSTMRAWPGWTIPVLIAVGAVVAVYLSYVEITNTEAVCGPVGHCNDVQQSPHATLFGILPVGVLGILGYIAMAGAWLISRSDAGSVRDLGHTGLWAMALFGTLFSVYLTFLEPFVIGASCVWCLTSAVAVTLILRASTPDAIRARGSGSA